ncbi:luciferase-like monooxygenase family protein [Mycobacterium intracellulare MIN_052511_1280]|nr:luciferase-like monooxygenase family protein [Mycobacterium intracellulare MIN_052511_1280]
MRLNSSTLSTFYYEPVHLARLLTTLDVLSDGRLDVGVGVGWMKDEHDIARGADWHRRGGCSMICWRFCTNGGRPPRCPGKASSSRFRRSMRTAPVQAGGPPIWIGGASEAAMRRVAAAAPAGSGSRAAGRGHRPPVVDRAPRGPGRRPRS